MPTRVVSNGTTRLAVQDGPTLFADDLDRELGWGATIDNSRILFI